MEHLFDEQHHDQGNSIQEEISTHPMENAWMNAAFSEEYNPMDNPGSQEYGEKEVLTEMMTKIGEGMIREVEI